MDKYVLRESVVFVYTVLVEIVFLFPIATCEFATAGVNLQKQQLLLPLLLVQLVQHKAAGREKVYCTPLRCAAVEVRCPWTTRYSALYQHTHLTRPKQQHFSLQRSPRYHIVYLVHVYIESLHIMCHPSVQDRNITRHQISRMWLTHAGDTSFLVRITDGHPLHKKIGEVRYKRRKSYLKKYLKNFLTITKSLLLFDKKCSLGTNDAKVI